MIGGIALVPALVGRRRIRNDERARIALHSDAIILRTRIIDALVLCPCVLGMWVAFGHAWYFYVDARIKYDLFISLANNGRRRWNFKNK